jgi:hypothetical protein
MRAWLHHVCPLREETIEKLEQLGIGEMLPRLGRCTPDL